MSDDMRCSHHGSILLAHAREWGSDTSLLKLIKLLKPHSIVPYCILHCTTVALCEITGWAARLAGNNGVVNGSAPLSLRALGVEFGVEIGASNPASCLEDLPWRLQWQFLVLP